ncbi:MAG TPA: cytochrome c oxidase assembly protein [Patescibacteria group bacterium]|nr:cytochrome c oxidase assembly protein [Patescibacteria group bacterium]
MSNASDTKQKNRRTVSTVLLVVAVMVGLSFASVPLYRLFCGATGFNGTTGVAKTGPAQDKIVDRIIKVRFVGNVARDVPWRFAPQQQEIAVKPGQTVKIAYNAENLSDATIDGTAVHNVTPLKAGYYFKKTQCFCFTDQVLKPHEKAVLPVVFFIDPALDKDHAMDDVTTITLSYTFFNKGSSDLDKTMEDFYNTSAGAVPADKTAKTQSSSVR